jgi:hypothetical protein
MASLARTPSDHELTAVAAGDPVMVGTRVEVRSRLDGRWSRGFEIAVVVGGAGYRVRRLSDGRELPAVFESDHVRRVKDRPRATWRY